MTEQDVDEQRVPELGVSGGWRPRQLIRLYCMNGGYHLQISGDGTVLGQRGDTEDVHSKTPSLQRHCAPKKFFCLFVLWPAGQRQHPLHDAFAVLSHEGRCVQVGFRVAGNPNAIN